MTSATEDYLRTGDVARLLGVSRQHVVDLCDRGNLDFVRVGSHRRIPRKAVDRCLHRPLTREQEKSLWLHRALLGALLADPDHVVGLARSNVDRGLARHRRDGMASRYLDAWREILDSGLDGIVETITSPTPAACELRQNTPFAGALSEDLRHDVLRSFTRHWRQAHESSGDGGPSAVGAR